MQILPLHCSELAFFDTATAVAKILSSLEAYVSSTRANKDALISEPFVVANLKDDLISKSHT